MKTFTIEDIRSWEPCYDPIKRLAENWSGTVIDILKHDSISPEDKLWVVCREDLIDAKTLRLFAVWCCRRIQHLMTDERSINAVDIAEKFANGEASRYELTAASAGARDAAWVAAWDAAKDVAWVAASAAAKDAAWVAAWAAARDAAWDAAWDAARDTASAAARAAAWDAASAAACDATWVAARDAAWVAAWDAARDAQIAQLIKMVEEE